MRRSAFWGGAVFGVLLGLGVVARAALGGADGVVIPYKGHLEQGGNPVTGAVNMRFELYTQATGGTPCFSANEPGVSVFDGEFSVVIDAVPESCVVGQPVFVGVVVNAGGANETALTGRQRIYPALAANTAGRGDFAVRGALDVAAAARSGTHATGVSAYVTGDMGPASGGLEVRHSNGTQGVGLGYNTVYATGSAANQDLWLAARGTGMVRSGPLLVGGKWRFADTGDDWLRIYDSSGSTYYGGVATGRLYASGNADIAGRVFRTEYDIACASGSSTARHYPYCCRIRVNDGVATCRVSSGTTYASWADVPSPFPNAGSDGPYSISCNTWVDNQNFPVCCRTGASGATNCAYNVTSPNLNGNWIAGTSPF